MRNRKKTREGVGNSGVSGDGWGGGQGLSYEVGAVTWEVRVLKDYQTGT